MLLTGFSAAIAVAVRRGVREPCPCFGASATPLGVPHVVRNAVLLAAAGVGAAAGTAHAGDRQPGAVLVAVAVAALLATVIAGFDDLAALLTAPPGQSAPRRSPKGWS